MKRWRLWLGLLISALFLGIALQGIAWEQFAESIRRARKGWLVLAFFTYFVTVGLRTWRWAALLRPLRTVSGTSLFSVMAIGYLGNNIYPFRMGELVRAYLLRRREGIAISASLATILVERIFDGIAVLAFVFLALPLAPLAQRGLQWLVIAASVAFFGALFIFLWVASRPELTLRLLAFGSGLLPQARRARVLDLGRRFLDGLASLRTGRALLKLYLASLVIWLFETVKFWLVMKAFPFSLNWFALMLTNGVTALLTVIPSAPGFIGTFDLPGIAMLVLYGVPETLAGAYILTLHVVLWLPSVVVGFIFMIREGLRWSDFGRLERARFHE